MCVLEEIAMQIDGVKAAGIADVVDGVKAWKKIDSVLKMNLDQLWNAGANASGDDSF